MHQLENKEWTNLWWDDADLDAAELAASGASATALPRVIFVGDSITYGYFGHVIDKMRGVCRITSLTTSKCVDNPWFLRELDFVMAQNDFKYSAMHFNNGLHGLGLPLAAFRDAYERAVSHILVKYPDTRLALALSIPTIDPGMRRIAEERNEAVRDIAVKYSLPVDDLFTPMLSRMDLHGEDGIHYTTEGYEFLAGLVAEWVRRTVLGEQGGLPPAPTQNGSEGRF